MLQVDMCSLRNRLRSSHLRKFPLFELCRLAAEPGTLELLALLPRPGLISFMAEFAYYNDQKEFSNQIDA